MIFRRKQPPKIAGDGAENLACDYLQQQGLRLIERNYHTRRGEIDLIMQHDKTLIFVEVRLRGSDHFGSAAESVTSRKQGRIIAAAQHYLQQQPSALACRFDVVAISGKTDRSIDWIPNAFQTD
ncbi:MAG: YraN family protein [Candidatus Polarisedimenticolaceae bacterium]|nr:YraN family protein [Candidatus Polarisedimenticolaceae bacterium]